MGSLPCVPSDTRPRSNRCPLFCRNPSVPAVPSTLRETGAAINCEGRVSGRFGRHARNIREAPTTTKGRPERGRFVDGTPHLPVQRNSRIPIFEAVQTHTPPLAWAPNRRNRAEIGVCIGTVLRLHTVQGSPCGRPIAWASSTALRRCQRQWLARVVMCRANTVCRLGRQNGV
jgi:hypothetical protein